MRQLIRWLRALVWRRRPRDNRAVTAQARIVEVCERPPIIYEEDG